MSSPVRSLLTPGSGAPLPEQILPTKDVKPESDRIAFLLRRDGPEKTRQWVERTAAIYREALAHREHYASGPAYRPLFERAVREFEEWLRTTGG